MYLIAGLGNPGAKYAGTRHNVGFEAMNKLAFDHKLEFRKMKHRAAIAEGNLFGQKVVLCKPHTFMNLSGESVGKLARFYQIPTDHIIVVYDDVDITLSKIRIRCQGSAGSHNGMKSLISHLPDGNFIRVRVGIDPSPPQWDLADYVLGKFEPHEYDKIIEGITKATEAVETILRDGISVAMNRYN